MPRIKFFDLTDALAKFIGRWTNLNEISEYYKKTIWGKR
jgi:hypothetical protein